MTEETENAHSSFSDALSWSLSTSGAWPLCSSSSRLLSPLHNFCNHHCTMHSLAVPGPNAMLKLRVVATALWLILNSNKKMAQICFLSTIISFSSVTQLSPILCEPHGLQHARLPCLSPTPGAYSNSCPSSQWCHPTISSNVIPLSSCLQSCPASGSLPISQFFASGDESIGVSASASVLPMNTQDWFPLGLTGWISLQSKGLSRVFSNTTVQKHQFFGVQLSLLSNSHIHTWLLEKP